MLDLASEYHSNTMINSSTLVKVNFLFVFFCCCRALNRQEVLNKKFANALQLEKELQWDRERKKLDRIGKYVFLCEICSVL